MASFMSLLAPFAWAIVAACITAAVLRKRSTVTRAVFGFLAACVAFGVIGDIRTLDRRALVSTSDDRTWSKIRSTLAANYPWLDQVFTLSPNIENKLKASLLPVMRDRDLSDPIALYMSSTAAIERVLAESVLPVAAHGSTEAVIAWGSVNTPILKQLASISDEKCSEFATTGTTRPPTNDKVETLLLARFQALVDAFKTSDSAKYPLSDRRVVDAQYAKALRIAHPPFSGEDLDALNVWEKQPQERQCNLLLRLFEAIDRLDLPSKAMIYRSMMKKG